MFDIVICLRPLRLCARTAETTHTRRFLDYLMVENPEKNMKATFKLEWYFATALTRYLTRALIKWFLVIPGSA